MNVVALVVIIAVFVGILIYMPADLAERCREAERDERLDELWDDTEAAA